MERKLDHSDAELLTLSRSGDNTAFAQLWQRHRLAGIVAARNIAPGLDADDLVSAAYTKILILVRQGKGPTEAFRPYLYRVLTTIAADTFRSPETTSPDLDEIPDLAETGPWEDSAFDLNAASRAFQTLPDRWRSVLWYSEVEGLAPRQIAPLLGLSANGVSALLVRAKEGLRSAWVEAHIDMQLDGEACRSTRERLLRYQQGRLTTRKRAEVEAHLRECAKCSAAAAEFNTLNKHLALIIGTLFLGGASAAALLDGLGKAAVLGGAAAASGASGAAAGTQAAAATTTVASSGASIGAAAVTAFVSVTLVAAAAGGVALVGAFSPDEHAVSDEQTTESAPSPGTKPGEDSQQTPEQPSDSLGQSPTGSEPTESTVPALVPAATESEGNTPGAPQTSGPGTRPTPKPPVLEPGPDPDPDPLKYDHRLRLLDVCYVEADAEPGSIYLHGELSRYGVLFARVVGGTTVIPITDPTLDGVLDPSDSTNRWNGILTGSDVAWPHYWGTARSLTSELGSVESYNAGTAGELQLRIQTPDSRTSRWIPVDQLVACF